LHDTKKPEKEIREMLKTVLRRLGYQPIPAKVKVNTADFKSPARDSMAMNNEVRAVLKKALLFYELRGDRIVATDLKIMIEQFEESLFLSSTDGSSVETAKLFGQVG
jgi:hypothetical protein